MELNNFYEQLIKMPMTAGLGKQIEILKQRYGDEYVQVAQEILRIFELLNLDAVKTSRIYIYDYLKQMDYFLKYKDYGHKDYDLIRGTIYDDEKTMMETYMPGLLLSYAYTTILADKNHLFLTEFLSRIGHAKKGIEIGFGEGFYIWEVLRKNSNIHMFGYDISPYAVRFASNMLNAAGISKENYSLQYGNIFEGISQPDESVDFGILAEVIEHIPNPELGIRETARMVHKGGYIYLTTVMNSNHMDHVTNFESPEEVQTMMEKEGLRILSKSIYYMTDDFPDSKDISVGLAYVAEKG